MNQEKVKKSDLIAIDQKLRRSHIIAAAFFFYLSSRAKQEEIPPEEISEMELAFLEAIRTQRAGI